MAACRIAACSHARSDQCASSPHAPRFYLRPVRFGQLIGQTALKARLIGTVREGRVAHAQFFLGPRGSGNLALALAYARYLFCASPGPADSCGECSACKQMDKLAHPDLHLSFPIFFQEKKPKTCEHLLPEWRAAVLKEPFLDAAIWRDQLTGENKQLRMGVDIALEVSRRLGLKAYAGRWKVLLLWLPELMDEQAANKLLKVLEEPEPGTVCLLVGSEADAVLPTILSRTQLVKVPALHEEDLAQALLARHPDLRPEEARACAVRSGGDLLEAMAMAEKNEEELFVLFRDWMRASYALKMPEAVELAEHFARMGRERQKALMRYGLHVLRMSLMHTVGATALVRAEGQEADFVHRFSTMLGGARADRLRQELETAHQHLERNANPKVLFMDLSYGVHRLLRA
ncbi:MAG: hypothetical protein GFGODING_00877 [Flavobacteriales bacterium]|nr:hypothetical protein [Flavobacteriales bacterium]